MIASREEEEVVGEEGAGLKLKWLCERCGASEG